MTDTEKLQLINDILDQQEKGLITRREAIEQIKKITKL